MTMSIKYVLVGLLSISIFLTPCNTEDRRFQFIPNVAKNSFDIGKISQPKDSIDIDGNDESIFPRPTDDERFPPEFGSGYINSGDDEDAISGSGDTGDGSSTVDVVATVDPCSGVVCQAGGLCLREGKTFRCQCPLGSTGLMCGESIDVVYPQFYGHSSMSLSKPRAVNMYHGFVITLKFKAVDPDGVLVFGSHTALTRGDFFSLELIDGRLVFRFSLGLPEVTITSNSDMEMNIWHTVTINRNNNVATMLVDDQDLLTVSAEASYNKMSLNHLIYVGGHTVDVFDKNQGRGLTGCIEELRINDYLFDMRRFPIGDAISGYDIGECSSGLCDEGTCTNGGSCIVTSSATHQCLCQLGFAGVSCERAIDVLIPSFAGYSYMAFDGLNKEHLSFFELSMIIKPQKPNGVLAYCSQSKDGRGDFLSLNLVDGFVEFRFDCGTGPAVIRSFEKLVLGNWNSVAISRTGRDAVLMVNDVGEVKGISPGGFSQTTFQTDLFIGGVPDYDRVASKAELRTGFVGDIQRLKVDGFPLDLMHDALYGIGIINANHHCTSQPCENSAQCMAYYEEHKCHCHIGFYGENCENEHDAPITVPMFNGFSYLKFTDVNLLASVVGFTTEMQIEFRTMGTNGLIFWTGQERIMTASSDYMSLGLQNGFLKFSYNLGSGEGSLMTNGSVNDGLWHTVSISRTGRDSTLVLDGKETLKATSKGSLLYLNTNNGMYIGGMNDIEILSWNRYQSGFKGCIRMVQLGGKSGNVDLELIGDVAEGRNIHHCS